MRYPKILSVFFTFVLALTGITVAQAVPAEAASVTQVPSAGTFVPAKAATALATTQANAGIVANQKNTGFVIAANKRSITSGERVTFSVRNFTNAGKARTGKVQLQYYRSGKWHTAKTLTLKNGRASFNRTVKNSLQWRYRYAATGAVTKTITVAVKGSVLRSTTSAAKKTSISLAASRTSRLATQSSKLTAKYYRAGKLQKKGNLYLQYKSGSRWITVLTMKINSKGVATTTVKPNVNRTYRVVNANRKVVSPTRKVNLKSGFTITPNKTSTTKGKGVRFTAEYYANGKPRTGKVQLQFHKNGKWNNRKTITLKNGKASYTTKPSTTLKWRFYHPGLKKGTKSLAVSVKPQLTLTANTSTLTSGGSAKFTVKLTRNGSNVASEKVSLQTHTGGKWVTLQSVTVKKGTASITVKPTATTKYRISAKGVTSAVRTIAVRAFTPAPAPTPTSSTYWVNSKSAALNMRKDAGTVNAIVSKLAHTSRVTATSASTKTVGSTVWRQVTDLFGNTGWVSTEYLTKTAPAKSFVFQGSGFGHGAGMPQYGAYAMAVAGKSASQILEHYFKGSKVAATTTPSEIAVRINGASKASGTTATISTGSMRLRNAGNTATYSKADALSNAYQIEFTVDGADEVKALVRRKSDKAVVATHSAKSFRLQWSDTRAYSGGSKAVLSMSGASGTYRHGFMRISRVGNTVNVVNVLRLNDEYLYGLSEMSSSWGVNGRAALEAQVIAGRSYAMSKGTALKASCDCNLVDSTTDQVFTGWTKENGASSSYWKAAVNATHTSATKAQVLTVAGKPVATHYYSYSGGKTANAHEVWTNGATLGSKIAHEISVSDPWSAKAPGVPGVWQHVVTEAQLLKIFTQLSDIAEVKVTSTYASGQARQITAYSASGKAQSIRRSDSGTSSVAGWRTLLKGYNNKIMSSGIQSAPASWITSIKPN